MAGTSWSLSIFTDFRLGSTIWRREDDEMIFEHHASRLLRRALPSIQTQPRQGRFMASFLSTILAVLHAASLWARIQVRRWMIQPCGIRWRDLVALCVVYSKVSVIAQPVLIEQPSDQTNFVGRSVSFRCVASSEKTLSYQWRSYSSAFSTTYTNIPFGTNATLLLTNIQPTSRRLVVVVTDADGLSVTNSPRVQLTAVAPTVLTPTNPSVNLFADLAFRATAPGPGLLGFQWYFNGDSVPGATSNTFVRTNIQKDLAGTYSVVSTYTFGTSTSQLSTLSIVPFTLTPSVPTASLFADITLRLTNKLASSFSYQWLFNGDLIPGADTQSLSITNVQKSDAGDYALVLGTESGSITSAVARLSLTPYHSLYSFGDSWTDVLAAYHGCATRGQCPDCYWSTRYSNGPMWPEFLSTNLGLAFVETNNFAVCGATTEGELRQVTVSFHAPPHPELSLYTLWLVGNDFLRAYPPSGYGIGYVPVSNTVAWKQIVDNAVRNNSNTVHRLYLAGARSMLFQNTGGTNETDIAALGLEGAQLLESYIERFNANFDAAMSSYSRTHPDVRLVTVDMFTRWQDFYAHPNSYGYTNIYVSALDDPNLKDKSINGPGADYYLWDALHATSKFHKVMAGWIFQTLTNAAPETLEASRLPKSVSLHCNHLLIGRDYTLQRSLDLSRWNDLGAFTASAGTNTLTQVNPVDSTSFYRLQWNP